MEGRKEGGRKKRRKESQKKKERKRESERKERGAKATEVRTERKGGLERSEMANQQVNRK